MNALKTGVGGSRKWKMAATELETIPNQFLGRRVMAAVYSAFRASYSKDFFIVLLITFEL